MKVYIGLPIYPCDKCDKGYNTLKELKMGKVLKVYLMLMYERGERDDQQITTEVIRRDFKAARHGVSVSLSYNAIHDAIREAFPPGDQEAFPGLDDALQVYNVDKNVWFPYIRRKSLATLAGDCRVVLTIPHHNVGEREFAEGFNYNGGFLAQVDIATLENNHQNNIVAVWATRTVTRDVLFVVTSGEALGAYSGLHDFLVGDGAVRRETTTFIGLSTVSMGRPAIPGTMVVAVPRGPEEVFCQDLTKVFDKDEERGRLKRGRTPCESVANAAAAEVPPRLHHPPITLRWSRFQSAGGGHREENGPGSADQANGWEYAAQLAAWNNIGPAGLVGVVVDTYEKPLAPIDYLLADFGYFVRNLLDKLYASRHFWFGAAEGVTEGVVIVHRP